MGMDTLVEELLGGLVGIHVAFAKRGVDLLVGVAPRDLLDVLDRPPHRRRDRNPSRRHHLSHLEALAVRADASTLGRTAFHFWTYKIL